MIREGALAPDFTLVSDSGENATPSELRGSPVALYLFPTDDPSPLFDRVCN